VDGRLDKYLAGIHKNITRSQIINAVKAGDITVNGGKVKAGYILRESDVISGEIKTNAAAAKPENIKLDIIYEDDSLFVVNKPRGMVVHPGAGIHSGTLLNGLLGRQSPALERAGIVHRLDKNTAGLLIVAKTLKSQETLSKMFAEKQIQRTYIGLVEGRIVKNMAIDKNIIRNSKHRTLFTVTPTGGRKAVTHVKTLEIYNKYTLCEFTLETGRTHQIRVHCKSIGHPIVGDTEYNPGGFIKTGGQMLEAIKLEFLHPVTKSPIKIEISPTKEFTNVKKMLYN
jgi:23S rRNA pseudouridine1911/1915/1917 synthase